MKRVRDGGRIVSSELRMWRVALRRIKVYFRGVTDGIGGLFSCLSTGVIKGHNDINRR